MISRSELRNTIAEVLTDHDVDDEDVADAIVEKLWDVVDVVEDEED